MKNYSVLCHYRLTTKLTKINRCASSQIKVPKLQKLHQSHIIIYNTFLASCTIYYEWLTNAIGKIKRLIQWEINQKFHTHICVPCRIHRNKAFRVHFSTDLSPEAKASALSMAEAVESGLIVIKWFAIPQAQTLTHRRPPMRSHPAVDRHQRTAKHQPLLMDQDPRKQTRPAMRLQDLMVI